MNVSGAVKVLGTAALFWLSMEHGWPLFLQVTLGVLFVLSLFMVGETP